jgi:hypothetical protein
MFTRKHFLSFPGQAKQQAIQQICLGVNRDICRVTALGSTSYMYQPRFAPGQLKITNDELVEALQRKFAHCGVVYREALVETVQGQQLKKGIVIDWS